MNKYDLILALIPTLFVKMNVLGYFFNLPTIRRIFVASIGGLLVVCYALFINPPGDVKLLHHQ